jgi:3-deoxy-D-manno-octulosonic-acid transferase
MTNFRDAAALLVRADAAVQVGDGAALVATLRRLLGDAPARQALGRAAWSAVRAHQGACVRTVAALERVLEAPGQSKGARG